MSLCECGCGAEARTGKRFIYGHNPRLGLERYKIEDRGFETPCWIWTGGIGTTGYGKTTIARKTILAHRASYEAHRGQIPDGLTIDHLCKVKACVNPGHLEPVTLAENVRRGNAGKPHWSAQLTHCKHGHEFTPENTYIDHRGARQCRVCISARSAAYYQRKKAAAE